MRALLFDRSNPDRGVEGVHGSRKRRSRLNWQTGGLQFSGEYRAYPFAGKSNRTDLYSDVATKMELVGLHFRRTDIEDICARSTFIAVPQLKKGKGRPAGAGSMDKADAPLLLEMRELIEKGKAFSPNGAAMLVAGKAAGNGTQESKIARLGRRYGALEKN